MHARTRTHTHTEIHIYICNCLVFISQMLRSPDAEFISKQRVRVKLTGDGTNIGKRLHVVNFGFTILDEGESAYSASGNHCIAIFKETEDYNSLKIALQDIVAEVESLSTIRVNGKDFQITYYLGGDWKFLAMCTGIDSASSKYACIWCHCPAQERHLSSANWSIINTDEGARSIEESIKIVTSKRKEYNVSHMPIFRTIPLTRVVVDNLHMFLRVADTLVDLLIHALLTMDRVSQSLRVQSLRGLSHLSQFQSKLKEMGISGYSFWVGKESKKLKWRTLTGPEKLTVFTNIDLPQLFPDLENVTHIQKLWNDFLEIHRLFSMKPSEITEEKITKFQADSKKFVDDFVTIYLAKHVTPYMHCMMHHVSEFMALHGSIVEFTQQGLEKYNDLMTKDFFRSTSHRGMQCFIQILQKQNRLEHLESIGAKRSKLYKVQCSNCKEHGHNKLTCKAPCSRCKTLPFCGHLIDSNGKRTPKCQLTS